MKFIAFVLSLLAFIIGLIKLANMVPDWPYTPFVYWIMLYTIGILGFVFSLKRIYQVRYGR